MSSLVVEKANSELGIIIFKCIAVNPRQEDADGDIPDAASAEKAFYEFMADQPDEPVDLDHKTKISGKCVAGWFFEDENCFRVAFKPDDADIVTRAKAGEFDGSSYAATVSREPLA